MVKWTTFKPYIGLNENDSKLYTNFEFFKEFFYKQLKNTLIYNTKQFMSTKKFKKSPHILEEGASDVQVGGINK